MVMITREAGTRRWMIKMERDDHDHEEEVGWGVKMGCLCIRYPRQEKQDHIFRPGGTPPSPQLYLQGHQHISQNTYFSTRTKFPDCTQKEYFEIETI